MTRPGVSLQHKIQSSHNHKTPMARQRSGRLGWHGVPAHRGPAAWASQGSAHFGKNSQNMLGLGKASEDG